MPERPLAPYFARAQLITSVFWRPVRAMRDYIGDIETRGAPAARSLPDERFRCRRCTMNGTARTITHSVLATIAIATAAVPSPCSGNATACAARSAWMPDVAQRRAELRPF